MPDEAVVEIKNFRFTLNPVVIRVGETVTWKNLDATQHTATRDDPPAFDTGLLRQGKEKTITFTEASSAEGFEYYCTPHPDMRGRVVVLLAGSEVEEGSLQK